MADDAGALLVRSGLVTSNALDDARARVASIGGTLGEQLVTTGAIADDDLTDFYRARLLVPQVNPNTLARLTPKVVATIPGDMAIELRAIPVSLDGDNNLTVAMSDPSDRHAVDEIAFFTGAYVVRAVATQMQIAWCLAHYYGHVTLLGQRLLSESERESPVKAAFSVGSSRLPRAKGLTGKVNAARHRAVAPVTGPINPLRPTSSELDRAALALPDVAATPADAAPASAPRAIPTSTPPPVRPEPAAPAPESTATSVADRSSRPTLNGRPGPGATASTDSDRPARPLNGRSEPGAAASVDRTPQIQADGASGKLRARSMSGEIRAPIRRAASIRPLLPTPDFDDDDDEPQIVIEHGAVDDDTASTRKLTPRRRIVKSDPPELYARAGEVDLKSGADRSIDANEPRIVVDEQALATPSRGEISAAPVSPPLARGGAIGGGAGSKAPRATDRRLVEREEVTPLLTALDFQDDDDDDYDDGEAVIHDRLIDRESQPILLDRPRGTPEPFISASAADDHGEPDDDVVVLDARKPRLRSERRTQVGVAPAPAAARTQPDTDATERIAARSAEVDDTTITDLQPVQPGDDTTSDLLAIPPSPAREDDTNPYLVAPPPEPAPPTGSAIRPAAPDGGPEDDDESGDNDGDDGEPRGRLTNVMSAVELDDAIPERTTEIVPAHLARRRIDHDAVDDGWGPPGTTIPPPLLGAIPGSEDEDTPSAIPMPSVDSSPLLVEPPQPASAPAGLALVRALETATARAIEVIRQLERAQSRDQVVDIMLSHLAEAHHRAGFFVSRPAATRGVSELSLFAMKPKPEIAPFATLRLDRPSTLQDVVGTRLPYRGPMHDDASRSFLVSVLGACPAEILLVPVAVRERVVGVLFGEHRLRHTFDDQLALAARAAGMALERILKARRS